MPQTSTCSCRTLTPTCPRTFKTAVCPASNPPNASAGLQGNNSYSYYMPLPSVFQGVQDCRWPAFQPPKRFQPSRRPPRQQLLQLHAPAICFSGGSRLPFARPQTPQTLPTLPQASKATTLTATCPCHLFFRGFKTAVCPPSNPPNASNAPAGLQGNNSYSYMTLPSVFQGVQDCRLPALKPPKRFQRSRRPPRQQLLQLHVPKPSKRFQPSRRPPRPCHLFFRGSRLPFARPQTPQTLPQASKATTLTAPTCPCHLFFRGFKTAVGPPSNPPNASNPPAGLQGNNSYSYMPLPSVFPGVQDCRLPALKPPKRFQRPAGLQGNNSYSYMSLPSVFQGVQDCRLLGLKPPKRFQPSRRPPRQQLLQLHAPAICFSGGSRLPFARPQTPQTLRTLPQASKATTLTATCPCHLFFRTFRPCHLFFRGFKTAVCPPSNPPNASNAPAGLQGNNSYSSYMPLPSVFQGVQDCRWPAFQPPKRFQPSRRPPRQQLLQLHAPAICFSGGSRLPFAALKPPKRNAPAGLQGNNSQLQSVFQGVQDPFARPQTLQTLRTLPQASKATTLTATCPCHLFFRGFKTAVCYRPQTPQTLPTLPQASKATTLTATCPCHLFFRGFKTAVCPPSNPPNASNPPAGLQGNNSYSYYMSLPSVFRDVHCRLPAELLHLHAPGRSRLLQTLSQASKATTLTATTCPCHLFFRGFKTAVCPPSNPPNASNPPAGLQGNNSYSYMPLPSVFQGVQDCRLPALKPPKRFQPSRRPPRQQLLQLHAPAICFSGGSRLPFARPQTPQTLPTLPQASKATTLTATCPCHLFFRGFKTAVCPPSNPPNASNAPAGLQGNNSYSYMPLPSVFQGVQDCRLPALKPPKRFQRSRRPPRQQLLQLHVPAICFSGTFKTAAGLPSTCHLFFRTFKTAVCPASNPPNASAGLQGNNSYSYYMPLPSVFQGVQGLQGNNSYSYMPLPSVFQGVQTPQTPQTLPTLPQASKATTLTATCPCHLFFTGVQDCRLPALKCPPNASNAPQASKATTLTATCPCHLFFRGFKTAVCSASNPPNASNPPAGLQGNNSYSYMPLPSVFQGVQDCRLPALKPPKRFQRSRRPPRQQLLQLHVPAICFSGGSRLPFAAGLKPPKTASNPPAGLQGNNSYSYMPLPSVFQGVQDCRLPALKPPKRFQPSRRPPRQQLLQLHVPAICFSGGSRLPFACRTLTPTWQDVQTAVCPASNPPNASAGLQGNNSYSYYMPLPSVFQGVQDCRLLPASNPPNASNPPAGLQGNNSYSYMPLPSVFQGVQDCRLPALKPPKRFQRSRRPPRQQLLQLHVQGVQTLQTLPTLSQASKATTPQTLQTLPTLSQPPRPCHLFFRGSRLPFARPQTPQTLPQASKATTLTATTCPCHLFFRGFKTAVCPPQTPQTLPTLPQASKATTLTATCPCHLFFTWGSRLPFARPQTPQTLPTLPQASKATTLTATCPCHLFFRGFKTAVCPQTPQRPLRTHPGLQGNNSSATCPCHLFFRTFKTPFAANSYTYMPLPPVFQDVQDCRLPGLKPSKRFRRPPRQQLLQLLHAPAICFSGGSRLPFARLHLTPQTLPTLPQASKATTLTATCPCHLFFRGFKTAVCPPSNPPNASNAPAGLQGNNSYSYMSLPSVFQGVQDCRLLGLKPPKRFQPSRRPPRQQLLQLHAPAICFSGGSRLPFARPQTPQTLRTLPALSRSALCPKEGGVGGTRALARFIYSYIPSLGGHYHGSTH